MADVIKHIDTFLKTVLPTAGTQALSDDYAITGGNNATSVDKAGFYIMRDTSSWWIHWGGSLRPSDYWKQIYVAFAAIPDDVQLSPAAFLGLLGAGLTPEEVEFAEMCLWGPILIQYFEKVDSSLYGLLKPKKTLMTQYRMMTGRTLGCAALLLTSEGAGAVRDGLTNNTMEAALIAQYMSMDMAKEALGILQGRRSRLWQETGYN